MTQQQGEEKIDELVNAFFKEWLPDSFAHLVDNDENDGERLRRELYALLAQTRRDTVREVTEKIEYDLSVEEKSCPSCYIQDAKIEICDDDDWFFTCKKCGKGFYGTIKSPQWRKLTNQLRQEYDIKDE